MLNQPITYMKNQIKTISIATFSYFLLSFSNANEDKWYTKNGHIDFYSHTDVEDIKANNETVVSVLDQNNGKIEFKASINSFLFEKKLMQEHFRENYMESSTFPDAKYSGTITNNSSITYGTDGNYSVTTEGKLTLHGLTKEIKTNGKLIISNKGNDIKITSKINVKPEDYGIIIPSAVRTKIAPTIEINLDCKYTKLIK